jgi:hypothetical protein
VFEHLPEHPFRRREAGTFFALAHIYGRPFGKTL